MNSALSSDLAPVVLFVYNRPIHTKKVLDALSKCKESKNTILYIFSDGQVSNATQDLLKKINDVRNLITNEKRFLKVITIFSDTNKGLAESVIYGISFVLNQHSKIIVLEDDLVVSRYFLEYMNDGLSIYASNSTIGSICAYWEDSIEPSKGQKYFLLNGGDCWGWATWSDRWSVFERNAEKIKMQLLLENKVSLFEFGGMMDMLDKQIKNEISSWHIRWHGSLILNSFKSVYPGKSFIHNIGLDGSGTHGDRLIKKFNKLNTYKFKLLDMSLDDIYTPENEEFIKKQFKSSLHKRHHVSVLKKIKIKFKSIINLK
jgi:hypothetical protein